MTVENAAKAAAHWWAEQVAGPEFKAVSGKEPARDRVGPEMASMFASMLADLNPPPQEQLGKFELELYHVIKIAMKGRAEWSAGSIPIYNDYGPDPLLADAAERSGIALSRFPWKTSMQVHQDYVTAALGYGARFRLVWSEESWDRPKCEEPDQDPSGYVRTNYICGQPRYHDGDHGLWSDNPKRCSICSGTYFDHFKTGGVSYVLEEGGHTWRPKTT